MTTICLLLLFLVSFPLQIVTYTAAIIANYLAAAAQAGWKHASQGRFR
jgi:hypothetical protein